MKSEAWNSKIGVILAVAGSAVGLGNFLKFPGQVAMYGGAAFMIAYVLSFLAVGVPIAVLEWTMGRYGGTKGFHSPPGILGAFCGSKKMAYVGIFGVLLTIIIYCYYIYIEAWCLGYACNFLAGTLGFGNVAESGAFFSDFAGTGENGAAMSVGLDKVLVFFAVSFFLNFWMIYRGVARGIEFFCKYAMPTLVVLAVVIVARIMCMGIFSGEDSGRSINLGMGFMWNPVKVELQQRVDADSPWVFKERIVGERRIASAREEVEKNGLSGGYPELRLAEFSVLRQLSNPSIWIAAAGQVFFSLTVGFGAIMTYASYLRPRDDIVLSALTSCSANEFCEVCLGGMITVPAAVAFLGVSGVISAGISLFDLGFKVLPLFFASMPFGRFFGFLFFFLLFLAAVTSSLSMLQPSMAFMEESMRLRRNFSSLLLLFMTFFISGFVVYFSKDLKAMDTFDFWMGQVAVYMFAMVQTISFAWYFGAERGVEMANVGSSVKIPGFYCRVVRYATPSILVAVFVLWLGKDVFGLFGDGVLSPYICDLFGLNGRPVNMVAWMGMTIIFAVYAFFAAILSRSDAYSGIEKEGRTRGK